MQATTHSSSLKTVAELGPGDVKGLSSLLNLIDGLVVVGGGNVGHHLEGNHLDVELARVLGHELLQTGRESISLVVSKSYRPQKVTERT